MTTREVTDDATENEELRWPTLDGAPGPALPLTRARHDALVGGVLHHSRPIVQPRRRSGRVAALLVAAVVVTAGGAAAGGAVLEAWRASGGSVERVETAEIPERISAGHSGPREGLPQQAQRVEQRATDEPRPQHESQPDVAASARAEPVPRSLKPPVAEAAEQAVDELAEANRLRASRRWAEASDGYRRVRQRYPHSIQAQVAMLAEAELLLLHLGQPARARDLFERMTESGSLGPEAWFGLARAEKSLGNLAGQRQALAELVRRFPGSALVPAARRSLEEGADGGDSAGK